ncbi:MAG: hypothetical protein JWQ54_5127 [Mucilaginibacter sp.]|nr:hypothetical protein [Mucilaginibacter sp.]
MQSPFYLLGGEIVLEISKENPYQSKLPLVVLNESIWLPKTIMNHLIYGRFLFNESVRTSRLSRPCLFKIQFAFFGFYKMIGILLALMHFIKLISFNINYFKQ